MLFLGWLLVRWGQRHHEAAIARKPTETPSLPPAVVRYGLLVLLVALLLSLLMVLAALAAAAFGER